VVVPADNGREASLSEGTIIACRSLLEVTDFLRNGNIGEPVRMPDLSPLPPFGPDLADVRGQQFAKRALEVAAAGGHNILFVGPPGTGKSMLAQRLPRILPPLTAAEAIETAAVNSVLGLPLDMERWRRRPFRSPHHTASAVALVGGGAEPRPGEVSRSHNGVLFLDELAEFNRHVLEVLREPLETGSITISRAQGQADFPARFQMVAAMNPCPCGYNGDKQGDCRCSSEAVQRYRAKISGPLLDRIDIHIEVERPPVELLRPDAPKEESSEAVAERIAAARRMQQSRCGKINAGLSGADLNETLNAERGCFDLLEKATENLSFSARAYQRVQRVARTIADLAGCDRVSVRHMAEALGLRHLDRGQRS
jgi:magnesium chelatase family protein